MKPDRHIDEVAFVGLPKRPQPAGGRGKQLRQEGLVRNPRPNPEVYERRDFTAVRVKKEQSQALYIGRSPRRAERRAGWMR